jgi:hypothetical protein
LTAPVVSLVGVRATLVGASLIGTAATAGALLLPGMLQIEGTCRVLAESERPSPQRAAA